MLYEEAKKETGRPKRRQSDDIKPEKTVKKVAEQTGVSAKTIERDAKFAAAVKTLAGDDPENPDRILSRKRARTRSCLSS